MTQAAKIDPQTQYIPTYQDKNIGYRCFLLMCFLLFAIFGYRYFVWRLESINPDEPILSWLLYASEFYIFILALTFVIATVKIQPKPRAKAEEGLKVDVLIPSYDESIDIVRRTVIGALAINYPHETWLLDDGNRPHIKALAKELGCRYLTREKNLHAKAGNLNNALKHCTGGFVLVLDADHVAEPYILDKMLGYFNNPKVAFAQAPQDYFNLNSFEHYHDKRKDNSPPKIIWGDQYLFYRVLEQGRDYWNGMHACGTSLVLRRSCLDEIGGFPTETATEDLHVSLRMHKRGYQAAYHNEPLAYGLGAGQYDIFTKQRYRWQHGNLHACRLEHVPFCRGLSFMQRVCYSTVAFSLFQGWARVVLYFIPVLVLLFEKQPIIATFPEHASYFFPFVIFSYLYYNEFGHGKGRLLASEHFAMATFYSHCMAAFGMFFSKSKFIVTPKHLSGQFPILKLLPQVAILSLNFVGVVLAVIGMSLGDDRQFGIIPIVSFWALVNCYLAWSVIRSAMQCEENDDNYYQFELPLPIETAQGKTHHVTQVLNISAVKLAIKGNDLALNKPVKGRIFLPSGEVAFTGKAVRNFIQRKEIFTEIQLEWENQAEKDALEQVLHRCTWHRSWLGQRHYVKTLFYFIDAGIRKCLGCSIHKPNWQPVPFYYTSDKTKHTYLALKDMALPEKNELLVLKEIAKSQQITLKNGWGVQAKEEKKFSVQIVQADDPLCFVRLSVQNL